MKLIFIYNANSGVVNTIFEALHKSFKPSTYECSLCMLTYHHVGRRSEWSRFIKKSGVEMDFTYKNLFEKSSNFKTDYPVVLKNENGVHSLFIGKEELDKMSDLTSLISLVESRMND